MRAFDHKTMGQKADALLMDRVQELPHLSLDSAQKAQFNAAMHHLSRNGQLDVVHRLRMRRILGYEE